MIYETKEKLKKRELKKLNIWCENNKFYELDWFKLLTGFVNLKYNNKTICQDSNYCYLGIKSLTKDDLTLEEFFDFVMENSNQYFLSNRINNTLFKVLFNELALFFIARAKENHIEAFVHLYRIIEKMSIMFPLLYFKQSSNFKNVYKDVQLLMQKETGALTFYKNFQETIFSEKAFLDNSIFFNFFVEKEEECRELKLIYENLFNKKSFGISFINNNTLVVPFGRIIDFAVTIRNRYFHLSMEHSFNIEPIEMDMNLFFASINDNILNWIGVLYYEMFKILNKKL